jgi:biotin synthase-like enzyme
MTPDYVKAICGMLEVQRYCRSIEKCTYCAFSKGYYCLLKETTPNGWTLEDLNSEGTK